VIPTPEVHEDESIELHLVSRHKVSSIVQDEAVVRHKHPPSPCLYVPGSVPLTRTVFTYDIQPILEEEHKQLEKARWFAHSCQELGLVPYLDECEAVIAQRAANFKERFGVAAEASAKGTYVGVDPLDSVHDISPAEAAVNEYISAYQAASGDNVFLLPLNFKCLLDEYESDRYLPTVLHGRVIDICHYQVEAIKKKQAKYFPFSAARFISYLPLKSTFTYVELDLSPLVSPETLEFHRESLEHRERKRLERKQKEQELDKHNPHQ
jgi:hypothetical protein